MSILNGECEVCGTWRAHQTPKSTSGQWQKERYAENRINDGAEQNRKNPVLCETNDGGWMN